MILQRVQTVSLVKWALLVVLWKKVAVRTCVSEESVDSNQCGFWCQLREDRHDISHSSPWRLLCNFLDSGRIIYSSPSSRRLWMFTSLRDKRQCMMKTHMLADPASVECGEYDRMTERRINELKKSCRMDWECLKRESWKEVNRINYRVNKRVEVAKHENKFRFNFGSTGKLKVSHSKIKCQAFPKLLTNHTITAKQQETSKKQTENLSEWGRERKSTAQS